MLYHEGFLIEKAVNLCARCIILVCYNSSTALAMLLSSLVLILIGATAARCASFTDDALILRAGAAPPAEPPVVPETNPDRNPNEHDTPHEPEVPETPEVPHSPEVPEPNKPEVPEPDKPDAPKPFENPLVSSQSAKTTRTASGAYSKAIASPTITVTPTSATTLQTSSITVDQDTSRTSTSSQPLVTNNTGSGDRLCVDLLRLVCASKNPTYACD